MRLEAPDENHEVTIPLDGEITIQRAAELKEILWSHLQNCKVINFDASKTEALDVAGLQLLCSVHRTSQVRGGDAHILIPPSPQLTQSIKDAEFKRHCSCALDKNHSCLWTIGD